MAEKDPDYHDIFKATCQLVRFHDCGQPRGGIWLLLTGTNILGLDRCSLGHLIGRRILPLG